MPGRIKLCVSRPTAPATQRHHLPSVDHMAQLRRRQAPPAAPPSPPVPASGPATSAATTPPPSPRTPTPTPVINSPPPSPAPTSSASTASATTLITAATSSQDASTTPKNSGSSGSSNKPNIKGLILNQQTIIWLVVISVIVIVTFAVVAFLLCRCKRRRKDQQQSKRRTWRRTYHPSVDIRDGNARMSYYAWNRHHDPSPSVANNTHADHDAEKGFAADGEQKPSSYSTSANNSEITIRSALRQPATSFPEYPDAQPATPTGYLDQGGGLPQRAQASRSPAVSFLEPLVIDHNGIPVPARPEPVSRTGTPSSQGRYYSGFTKTLKRVSRIGMAM